MYDTWSSDDLEKAVDTIKTGGLILYPTDTIWGIGCSALNTDAILRTYQLKNRPPNKPLVILVSSIEMLKLFAHEVHPRVETLLEFHDKPLTIIYPVTSGLPDSIKAHDGSIAIRVIRDPFCQQLIEQSGFPLVSTSANQANHQYPNTFGEINSDIIKGVDYVCKYRQGSRSFQPPSVIASFNKRGALQFVRE